MRSETPLPPKTLSGLPPVEPPSGRLLGQLFLVPGLIVAGVVVVLLFFNWLVSGPRSAESFLRKLDEANPEVRWRAAADLSQVLLRDDRLAADPSFAQALALRLDKALGESASQEEVLAARRSQLSPAELRKEQARCAQERNYVNFLAGCLGNFLVPAGAPLLQELAVTDRGLEPKALAERRRRALWSLANLGESLKRFDKLPSAQQEAIVAALNEPKPDRSQTAWAQAARCHLLARMKGTPDAMDMDRTIEICGNAQEPFLRELAAFAANFWRGDPAAEARIEATLVRLCHDGGQGEELVEEWSKEEGAEGESFRTRSITKVPGQRVRMNAAIALARRGSKNVRPDVLAEMLDEATLRKSFVLRSEDGQESADDAIVLHTVASTLKAVVELHRLRPDLPMPEIRAGVSKLTGHDNAAIRSEAQQTQLALEK